MTNLYKTLAAVALVLGTSAAFAAKPTSIRYVEEIVVEDDDVYAHYTVLCSDDTEKDISAWDNRKNWCVGKGSKDNCSKKQIKTAKEVCK